MSTEEETNKEKAAPEPEAGQPKEQAGGDQVAPAGEGTPTSAKAEPGETPAAAATSGKKADQEQADQKPAPTAEKATPTAVSTEKPASGTDSQTPAKTDADAGKQVPQKASPQEKPTVSKPAVSVGTGVSRNKVQTGMPEVEPLLQMLADCAAACKRNLEEFSKRGQAQRFAAAEHASRACMQLCNLLHDWASNLVETGHTRLTMDLALVCARACETCHIACVKHPGESYCVASARIAIACAAQCRSFAKE